MNLMEAIQARHSVRRYKNQPIGADIISALNRQIEICNRESELNIQLVTDEPKAFDGFMAHYGNFSSVTNYIAMIGKRGAQLEEKCGYYGERLVLEAQRLGLNTCWVALTYSKVKDAFTVEKGEKVCVVIAVGYGLSQGKAHRSKPFEEVARADGPMPDWFKNGVNAALLAPTAMNQQKFCFILNGGGVCAKAGRGFYTKLDLGIVKYHFEIGSGRNDINWIDG